MEVDWNNGTTLALTGALIGLVIAAVGAAVEYRLHLRPGAPPRSRVPGCLLYVATGLGLAGIVAIIASFVSTGSVWPALMMGAGVLAGFYSGFFLLLGVWLFFDSRRTS
jgi:hypothetical protein